VSSYLTLVQVRDGAAKVLSTARYDDELRREGDGAWRFTKRHIQLDLPY
jgi:3-phenylpropionate/cinnamic acid dioxygenase small subunit